jgi:hypothetical protein
MNQIKVSEIGKVNIASVEALSYEELKAWINLRLHGRDTQIPSDFRQGDTPYYMISLLYDKLNHNTRERIHRIVGEFAKDMVSNPQGEWKAEAGHQLLLLINSVQAEDTFSVLRQMAESKMFFNKDAPPLAEDLHCRVLQTLIGLGYSLNSEFWRKQYELAPEQYAKTAFNGLSLGSLDDAIQFLFSDIKCAETVERILWLSFPSLINRYGTARIVPLVENYLPKTEPEIQESVREFFADLRSRVQCDEIDCYLPEKQPAAVGFVGRKHLRQAKETDQT